MQYLDFHLRIGAGQSGHYPVAVVASPDGEASDVAIIPVDDPDFWARFDRLAAVRAGDKTALAGDDLTADEAQVAEETGRFLFDLVFTGAIRETYHSSLTLARHAAQGLRIEAPELAALPWELLHDEAPLSLGIETLLTRYLELSRASTALTVPPPVRILGMVVSPKDLTPLAVDEEQRRVENAIDHLRERGDVQLTWLDGQSWRDLQSALRDGEWHILHFIGHGSFDPAEGEGLIAFANEEGAAHFLPASKIGQLVEGYPSLRLVVLNACEGARASPENLYSSVGAVMMQKGIPAVISMQYPITDVAALEFSRSLYDSLAHSLPVDAAVTKARQAISFTLDDSTEWATPVLHMRSPDGNLFDLDVASLVFPPAPPAATPASSPAPSPPLRAVPSPSLHPTTVVSPPKEREILLRRVHKFWVEGVLENSLFHSTLLDLGMETLAGTVDNPWSTVVERPGAASTLLPEDQTLATVFDEEGGSLLILGEPGSGKTTSLLDLARTLLARATADTLLPVPVIFTLSSWAATHATLIDWMAGELSAKYQMPRKTGKEWLEGGQVLPLLDGLDEQAVQARAACVEAINHYVLDGGLTGVVVCCRSKEYIELPTRLGLNAAVRLTELRDEQVQAYLAAAGEQLAGLQLALQQEPTLRIEARSPLMLNLLVRAYQGLTVADIRQERPDSVAARRNQIMAAYVARMYRRSQERRAV
jgi:hypothetical protein